MNGIAYLSKAALLCAAAAFSPVVLATSMLESERAEMSVRYENGDKMRVYCRSEGENCRIEMIVDGVVHDYGAKELKGLDPYPHHAYLHSGPNSSRAEYFGFEVEVSCPSDWANAHVQCYVYGLVTGGALSEVNVSIRRETREYVPVPDS